MFTAFDTGEVYMDGFHLEVLAWSEIDVSTYGGFRGLQIVMVEFSYYALLFGCDPISCCIYAWSGGLTMWRDLVDTVSIITTASGAPCVVYNVVASICICMVKLLIGTDESSMER